MAAVTSAVILEPKKIKSVTVSTVSLSIWHKVMRPDVMIFVFQMLSLKWAFSLSSFTFIKRLFAFCHKDGVICVCEVIDISPGKLDSSLCFIQPVFLMMYSAKSLQSCPTLCDRRDGSPPGSPIPGILQARTLEWVAISFSNAWKWKVKVKVFSCVRLLAAPWTSAYQAPPSMRFSRQEHWSGVPLPSPMMYSAYKLNKQHDNIQPWCTPFPVWNQSVVPCPVLTVASWPYFSGGRSGGLVCPSLKEFSTASCDHTVKGFAIVSAWLPLGKVQSSSWMSLSTVLLSLPQTLFRLGHCWKLKNVWFSAQ